MRKGMKSELGGEISELLKDIDKRLMTLRLPLSGNKHAQIVNVFTPTVAEPDEVNDKFFNDLDHVISATRRTYKIILFGAFNFRFCTCTYHQTWEGSIGPASSKEVR